MYAHMNKWIKKKKLNKLCKSGPCEGRSTYISRNLTLFRTHFYGQLFYTA
jgi:hypothetical protein